MKKRDLVAATQAAFDMTEKVTTRWTSRLTGSKACLECGDFLKEQFATFCNHTQKEEFHIRPLSFLLPLKAIPVLYVLSFVAILLHQYTLGLSIAIFAFFVFASQLIFYWEIFDFLVPQKKGQNVFGTIEPSREVKQQIIVSAHHDSAHIFNFLQKNPLTYNTKINLGFLGQFGMLFATIILMVLNLSNNLNEMTYWIIIGIIALLSLPVLRLWFFFDLKNGTPGAGDNMICTAIAMEIGKYFSTQETQLKHTRVVVASWDSEECGLRGARAYVKKHQEELQQIKTLNFNLECMYDHAELHFLTSDLNGLVQLSKEMVKEGMEASQKLEYPIQSVSFPLLGGGTDAAEFAKAGIEATTLVAMSWTERKADSAYHTTRDTLEAVDREAVYRSIDIGIQYVLDREKTMTNT